MTQTRSLRPDARLVHLHAERGDPGQRLAEALAHLEGTDWGLLLSGEAALARQLAALFGPGTLRVDGRIDLSRSAFAEAGLAVADLHGDLKGARAVLLFDPDDRTLERAQRAGVRIVVDGTLSPGSGWAERGVDYVVYRDGVTLTGHADAPFAALFGVGTPPEAAAPAPSDLSVALALRDVATLPLRLARAARTVSNLAERLGGTARPAGPTALLLSHEAAPDTLNCPGGVLSATRHVPDGVLLTPGLEDTERVLSLLREPQPGTERPEEGRPRREEKRPERRPERQDKRPERERGRRFELPRGFVAAPTQTGQATQGRPQPAPPRPSTPEPSRPEPSRPEQGRPQAEQATASAQPSDLQRFTFEAPAADEVWEPEIVFSDIAQSPVPLTHTVSNGPDAPDQRVGLPDVLSQPKAPENVLADDSDVQKQADPVEPPADAADASAVVQPTAATLEAAQLAEEAPIEVPVIAPDLPALPDLPAAQGQPGKDDPSSTLTDEQSAIYARLREWRNAEAKRQKISTFIIASNATLAEIARRIPYTEADLKAVKGMGPERMKRYGEKILEVVRG